MAGTMMDGTTRLHKDGVPIFHHSGVSAFAEYAVISQNALIEIDRNVPFDKAALFGCAVVTGVGSVAREAVLREDRPDVPVEPHFVRRRRARQ